MDGVDRSAQESDALDSPAEYHSAAGAWDSANPEVDATDEVDSEMASEVTQEEVSAEVVVEHLDPAELELQDPAEVVVEHLDPDELELQDPAEVVVEHLDPDELDLQDDFFPADFNDWGTDSDGSAEQAATSIILAAQLEWMIPELALGRSVLYHFGPNGPPMNVLDICPESQRLFVANQQQVFGFSIAGLEAQARGQKLEIGNWTSNSPDMCSQANRLRCGRIAGRSVAVAVDARGGTLVVPCDGDNLDAVLRLQNTVSQSNPPRGISTWGVALASYWEDSQQEDMGAMLVSANDHCLKAWWLRPPAAKPAESDSRLEGWQVRQYRIADGRAPPTSERPSWLLQEFEENLPCVDFAQGRALVASLDGRVCALEVRSPPPWHPPAGEGSASAVDSLAAGYPQVGGAVALPAAQAHSSTDAAAALDPEGGPQAAPRWPAWGDWAAGPCFFAPSLQRWRRTWNACWLPLKSVREVAAPAFLPEPPGVVMEWTARTGVALSGEIIGSSVLPLLQVHELLARVQLLSAAHAPAARAEVVAARRKEQMALIFSETCVWLTDGCLGTRCQLSLPFNASFAHVAYNPELSTAFVAPKLDPAGSKLWGITVLRRGRSLRFRLQLQALEASAPNGSVHPQLSVTVGMAPGPGSRLFALQGSHRLCCYHVALEDHVQGGQVAETLLDDGQG